MLPNNGHSKVGAVAPTERLVERVAVEAGVVSEPLCRVQQGLPHGVRKAVAVPVSAGVLASVVEEAHVVVLLLQRLDHSFDELIEFGE